MPDAQTIAELEGIIRSYTTFFLIFDAVFFALIVLVVCLAINFFKSKKNLRESDEVLMHTICAQEEERSRIARELHDTVAQDLRYCKSLADKNGTENRAQISALLEKSLEQIRFISYNLAPTDIIKNDFRESVVNLCNYLAEKSGMNIRLSIPQDTRFSFLTENDILNLYRIVQESVVNVIKHAHANEIVILIRNGTGAEENGLHIFISDDGTGFDTEQKPRAGHFGISGMKKRSQLIGGMLTITSVPGEGTQTYVFKPENGGG